MPCDEYKHKIEAYLDGELTLSDQRDVEEHLVQCKQCSAAFDNLRALSVSIKKVGYVNTPASLRRNIRHGLKQITGEDTKTFTWRHLLGASGGSAVLASVLVWVVVSFMPGLPSQSPYTDELIAAHVRSMMVDHVTDITSSDKHTVKPWFSGKLDFSPTVMDLKDEGYPLIGGRLDYLQQQPVAALVYKRRSHIINVFIRRSNTADQTLQAAFIHRQGYNLVEWSKSGLDYSLVSDLNAEELRQLASLLQG